MYCGQCGKKVMDNMLFCPFCGAPIVIPDQDAPDPVVPVARHAEPVQESAAEQAVQGAKPVEQSADPKEKPLASLFDALERPEKPPVPKQVPKEEFKPLRFDFDAPDAEVESKPAAEPEPERAPVVEDVPELPKRRSAPQCLENHRSRSANTYIPVKDMDLDDIFMDGGDADDAYDMDDGYDDSYGGYEDDFDYEEPESGSFFQRHIRGIVALILMLILLVVCAAWAFSPRGQRVLAQVNLAWSAEAYADLGYEAYQKDSDLLAARYYEKALNREPDNYEYAHSAMVAYYEADKLESAAAMLKKCVDLDPDNPEPYEELLILYPDPETRPWDVSELVRMGYQRTGADSLKQE